MSDADAGRPALVRRSGGRRSVPDLAALPVVDVEAWVKAQPRTSRARVARLLLADTRQGVRRLGERLQRELRNERQERHRFTGLLAYEQPLWDAGLTLVAGLDEAGRGPLAGPVCAAAVVLPPGAFIAGVDDSKKLTPEKRESLYGQIRTVALAVGVGLVDHRRIDEINILQATYEAMQLALANLQSPAGFRLAPQHLLLDAVRLPKVVLPQTPIIHGDALSASIAAASIIAKVTRDRLMVEMDRQYPGYGFAEHKGYSCRTHWDALRRLGPSPIHRLTFAGVAHPWEGGEEAGGGGGAADAG